MRSYLCPSIIKVEGVLAKNSDMYIFHTAQFISYNILSKSTADEGLFWTIASLLEVHWSSECIPYRVH